MTTPSECTCPGDGGRRLDCPVHGGTHPPQAECICHTHVGTGYSPSCPVHHDLAAPVTTTVLLPEQYDPTADQENLPAGIDAPSYAQTQVPMSQAPSVALGFALGYAVARPQSASTFGPFCAVVEALAGRFQSRDRSQIPISEWAVLVSLLPPDMVRRIELLYGMQRGQRWAQTGKRHPKSGN